MQLNPIEYGLTLLRSPSEFSKYNTTLQAAIENIQLFISQNAFFSWEGDNIILKLQNHISTNNHFVRKKRETSPEYTMITCVKMRDEAGLRYLLRAGENPNQTDALGFAAIHLAVLQENRNFIKILKEHPELDLDLKTQKGNRPQDLAKHEDIKHLLSEVQLRDGLGFSQI